MQKVFREGDVVKVTAIDSIVYGDLFFDEGDETVVAAVGFLGILPFILVRPTKNIDHEKLQGKKLLPVLLPEFDSLTLVRSSLENQFEDSERMKRHGIEIGDKVKITNVNGIMFGDLHFRNGDVVEVQEMMFGYPILKTPDNDNGLILGEDELQYIAKVAN